MYAINHQSGFTIIEALIYIGLFAFIMSGAILSAYQIFEGSAQVQTMAERETELNFVIRKIDWALNGIEVTDIQEPDLNETVSILSILKDGDIIDFGTDGTAFLMTVDPLSSPQIYDLSSPRLEISSTTFKLTDANPDILEITMVIDGDVVGPIKRYLR